MVQYGRSPVSIALPAVICPRGGAEVFRSRREASQYVVECYVVVGIIGTY